MYHSIMLLPSPKLTKTTHEPMNVTRELMNATCEPMNMTRELTIRTSCDPLQLVSAHIHIHCASAHCLHYSFVIHCPLSPPCSIIFPVLFCAPRLPIGTDRSHSELIGFRADTRFPLGFQAVPIGFRVEI